MKRYLLFAGYCESEYGYRMPAGWEAFQGDFDGFGQALEAYKKLHRKKNDYGVEGYWGQIIDTQSLIVTDCQAFLTTLKILTPDDYKVKDGFWGLWNRGFIDGDQCNILRKLPESEVEAFLNYPTVEGLKLLLIYATWYMDATNPLPMDQWI